jgi:hypothetical protein
LIERGVELSFTSKDVRSRSRDGGEHPREVLGRSDGGGFREELPRLLYVALEPRETRLREERVRRERRDARREPKLPPELVELREGRFEIARRLG